MEQKKDSMEGCLVALLAFPFLFALATIVNGFVSMKMWAWFMVPLGLPHIGYVHAAGIASLVSFWTYQKQQGDNRTPLQAIREGFAGLMILQPTVLLCAWMIHKFM